MARKSRRVRVSSVLAGADAHIDQATHDHVGFPEGHPLLYQVVGAVSGVDEAAGGSLGACSWAGRSGSRAWRQRRAGTSPPCRWRRRPAPCPPAYPCCRPAAGAFMTVSKAHQIAVDPAGLAAYQLSHVRIFLLGHDGGAGGIGVVQVDVFELPAAPQDDLLGEAGQVHHQDGAGGAGTRWRSLGQRRSPWMFSVGLAKPRSLAVV